MLACEFREICKNNVSSGNKRTAKIISQQISDKEIKKSGLFSLIQRFHLTRKQMSSINRL